MADIRSCNWDDLRLFLFVAQTPSLRVAAERLGVSAATLSRRVSALEHGLGTTLFRRRSRGLDLSKEGTELLARCRDIERLVLEATGTDTEATRDEVIDLTCLPALSATVIGALERFRDRWPGCRVVLDAAAELTDFDTSDVDVAIRLSRPEQGRFSVRRIGSLGISVYEHRDAPPDLPLILWGTSKRETSRVNELATVACPGRPVAMLTNDLGSFLTALDRGIARGVMADVAARTRPNLVAVPLAERLPPQDLWLVVREEARRREPVRDLARMLADTVGAALRAAAPSPHPRPPAARLPTAGVGDTV